MNYIIILLFLILPCILGYFTARIGNTQLIALLKERADLRNKSYFLILVVFLLNLAILILKKYSSLELSIVEISLFYCITVIVSIYLLFKFQIQSEKEEIRYLYKKFTIRFLVYSLLYTIVFLGGGVYISFMFYCLC